MAHPALERLQPEAAAELECLHDAAWKGTDPALLELCRRRVAALLRHPAAAQLREPAAVTAREQAFLDFTEQFVISVPSVSDDQVGALLAHAEPVEVYSFIMALYVVEMRMRLQMTAEAVLG